jgi:ribosomal subunit interface protein
MTFPLQIQFLSLSPSEAIETTVRDRFESLERFSDRIQKCHVWIEKPTAHHRKGRLYKVQARLTVPGEEIVISQPAEEDVGAAIRNAFDATRRKLEDHERRLRGRLKSHPRRRGRAADRGEAPEKARRRAGRP